MKRLDPIEKMLRCLALELHPDVLKDVRALCEQVVKERDEARMEVSPLKAELATVHRNWDSLAADAVRVEAGFRADVESLKIENKARAHANKRLAEHNAQLLKALKTIIGYLSVETVKEDGWAICAARALGVAKRTTLTPAKAETSGDEQ